MPPHCARYRMFAKQCKRAAINAIPLNKRRRAAAMRVVKNQEFTVKLAKSRFSFCLPPPVTVTPLFPSSIHRVLCLFPVFPFFLPFIPRSRRFWKFFDAPRRTPLRSPSRGVIIARTGDFLSQRHGAPRERLAFLFVPLALSHRVSLSHPLSRSIHREATCTYCNRGAAVAPPYDSVRIHVCRARTYSSRTLRARKRAR